MEQKKSPEESAANFEGSDTQNLKEALAAEQDHAPNAQVTSEPAEQVNDDENEYTPQ